MNAGEILEGALQYYEIGILAAAGNHFSVAHGYEIEVEANGIYKLLHEGQVVGPFDDVDELCRFILL